ncbi:hypothetical protein [Vampirovibrio sp.]|uniref:hypothetical protein n=1 Tax=Vampirovibrio sp. TaxID=2717857 RepID=UPI0035930533
MLKPQKTTRLFTRTSLALLFAAMVMLAQAHLEPAYSALLDGLATTPIAPSQNENEPGGECTDADGDGQCDADTDKE